MQTGGSAQAAERAAKRVGVVLREKWRLDELIGVGGMASVYSATHRNGQRAAIKILHPEVALSDDVRSRFQREGYLANKVGHPGAVSILDDDVDESGLVFLVMELIVGESVEMRWNRRGRLDADEALILAYQALDVLGAAHEKGIVHRDLKPSNLFIDTQGSVKILDFGIARLIEPGGRGDTGGSRSSLGTPGFMPPEQARGRLEEVDARSDLWALGATVFALVSGRSVHEAPTVNEQLLAAMTEPAPRLAKVLPSVPEAVASVVDRALSYAPNERYPDALSMRAAIAAAYEAVTGAPIEQSARLPVVLSPVRRVASETPTMGAGGVSAPNGASTTGPIASSSRKLSRGRRSAPLIAFGLALVAGTGIAIFVFRGGGGRASDPMVLPARLGGPVPAPTTAAPVPPRAHVGTALEADAGEPNRTLASPAAASASVPSASGPGAPSSKAGGAAAKHDRTVDPGASAKPVDIFTRRK